MIACVDAGKGGVCLVYWTGRGDGIIPSVVAVTYCDERVNTSASGVLQLPDEILTSKAIATCKDCRKKLEAKKRELSG